MKKEKGQALITLLVFMFIAITVISGAVVITVVNSSSTSIVANSEEVLKVAEAGADNAVLRLLRNPNYTGETLTLTLGTATITVTGTTTKTIISDSVNGNYRRRIQVVGTFSNNVFDITSWGEID